MYKCPDLFSAFQKGDRIFELKLRIVVVSIGPKRISLIMLCLVFALISFSCFFFFEKEFSVVDDPANRGARNH